MKLLAINASYRGERGYTQFLMERLLKGAASAGAECECLTLAKLKINHCLGCDTCQNNVRPVYSHQAPGQTPDDYELTCVYQQKDDVSAIFEKMMAADLILFATPIYVFQFSALLKTLLERLYGTAYCKVLRATRTGLLFHHVKTNIVSKPFAVLICCDNLEDETPKNSLAYFKTYSRFMEAPLVGTLVRNAGLLAGYGKDEEAFQRFPKLAEVYAAFEQAGRELVLQGRISRATQRKANQEIIPVPFFHWLKKIRWYRLKKQFAERAGMLNQKDSTER